MKEPAGSQRTARTIQVLVAADPTGTPPPSGTPPLTPTRRNRKSPYQPRPAQGDTQPKAAPKQPAPGPHKQPQGRSLSLLYGAGTVALLMLLGIAASDVRLRGAKQVAQVPTQRLSSASFLDQQQRRQALLEPPPANAGGGGLSALLASATSALSQLGAEVPRSFTTYFGIDAGAGAAAAAAAEPPRWQLRCAVVNNLIFHIDVMAGWTYAFQSAGCHVTVYQNPNSLGIEDVMSAWFTGDFRKPEMFPGEAGDYHIIVLPTFRDQHAELVQYLLQLPRLRKQRFFLTQHNPDWLLNHPNVDILQQQMLTPLLDAARARDQQQQEAGEGAADGQQGSNSTTAASGVEAPLLRVSLNTLAPCVSEYTLQFLREMAFNLTEGQTYSERVGSFRVRTGGAGDESGEKDNSEDRRKWIEKAINFEVPWLSPLVPWQPAAAPVIVPTQPAPSAAEEAAEESGEAAAGGSSGGSARRLHGKAAEDDASAGGGKEKDQGQGQKEGPEQRAAPAASPVPPPPPGPPLPPPGENATVLLAELDRASKGEYPRHICIQGKLENSRRNYTAAFEAISHPAVLRHMRATGERLLLLGHRSKWETVVIPEEVADVVVVLESLPYQLYFDTLSRCRAIMLAFATDEYYSKKSSSTIATAINVGVPLVAERRTLMAYTFLQPAACFVYDERQASSEATDGSAASQRRLLVAGAAAAVQGEDTAAGGSNRGSSRGLLKAGSKKGGKGGGKKQQKAPAPPKAAEVVAPLPGSYSAAVLAALRSESSIAAHQAVKQLKAEVMNHNQMVAAAFMAGTEGQFSAAERAADAAAWRLRVLERGPSLDAAPGGPAR